MHAANSILQSRGMRVCRGSPSAPSCDHAQGAGGSMRSSCAVPAPWGTSVSALSSLSYLKGYLKGWCTYVFVILKSGTVAPPLKRRQATAAELQLPYLPAPGARQLSAKRPHPIMWCVTASRHLSVSYSTGASRGGGAQLAQQEWASPSMAGHSGRRCPNSSGRSTSCTAAGAAACSSAAWERPTMCRLSLRRVGLPGAR